MGGYKLTSLVGLVLALAGGVAVGEELPGGAERAASRIQQPDRIFVVAPWRPSRDLVDWRQPVRSVGRRHDIWSPEVLAEMKLEAKTDPSAPQGRNLAGSEEDLDFEDLGGIAAPLAPKLKGNFDGLNRFQAGYDGFIFFPPDTNISASSSQLLQVTNVAGRLSNRSGKAAQVEALNNLFSVKSPDLFDPKVYFDRLSGRFFMVVLYQKGKKSFMYLAVSRSADPQALSAPDEFCTYRIKTKQGKSWADYPSLGVNENWFVAGVNNFQRVSGRLDAVYLYAIDVDHLTDNASSCPKVKVNKFRVTKDASLRLAFNIVPAQHYTTNTMPGTPLFLVSTQPIVPSNTVMLARLVTNSDGKPILQKDSLSVPTYSLPPDSPQRNGSDLSTGDSRMMSAAFRDGSIWVTWTTNCDLGKFENFACIRVLQITPEAAGGQLSFQETFGQSGWYYYWPNIAVNKKGDVAVVFQRSKEGRFLGVAFNGKRAANDAFDGNIRVLKNGRCALENLDGGVNRTGDYTGAQTDPDDNLSFYISGEWAGRLVESEGDKRCDWRTRIGRVKY